MPSEFGVLAIKHYYDSVHKNRPKIPMESTANGSASPTDIPTAETAASAAAGVEDPSSAPSAAAVSQWTFAISQRFQHLLDKSTPFLLYRWIAFLCIAFFYVVRVYMVQGFYVVSYALGIYILNLLIGFLSPQVDPEFSDSPTLPIRRSDEFRPFVRRLPEFKFWYSITKAFCIAFLLTFFSMFDVPVYWPILLFYWIVLCMLTLRRQIQHMIKYKYVPFSLGKQRYDGKRESSAESDSLLP
ncbi:protein RER1A [Sesamum alatum]|uniref:Protein RER1A n=1 Tax=Sesamum alatum TaxID=300844 RepID=A0AAE2CLB5_9LAMI|nr:protein RER1A [Sesamum alatum]